MYMIYYFIDENNNPFYVGITNNIKRRMKRHINNMKDGSALPKYHKLRKVLALDMDIQDVMVIQEEFTNKKPAIAREIDSYSGFFDNDGKSVGLAGYLKGRGVTDVCIMGLATDYCVKFTALDSVKCGFNTYLITDGCRAVNVSKGDGEAAISEMKSAGVTLIKSDKLTKRS